MNNPNTTRPLKIYKASAGSGKTFRLAVEYIKLLIENPMCYSNILAVTFTNKATAEMKMRILSQLYGIAHGLRDSDKYLSEIKHDRHIQSLHLTDEQMRLNAGTALSAMMHDYSRFRIETIDSFFQSIVRELAHELHLTNNLRVDLKAEEVMQEAVKQLINTLDKDKALLKSLLSVVEEKIDESRNWNIETEILAFGNQIFNEQFLENKNTGNNTTRQDVESFKQKVYALRTTTLQSLCNKGKEFLQVCDREGLDKTCFKGGGTGIYGFFTKTAVGELRNITPTIKSYRNNPSAWATDKHPEVAALAQDIFLPMLDDTLQLRRLLNTVEATRSHLNQLMLINSIDEKVRQLNSDENRFLLADTAYMLQQLIQGQDIPFIYEKAGVRFSHIMIDEFQDTSALQWKNFIPLLLNSMATNSRCLIVGDVKQSIYRWRNSDWGILKDIEQNAQFQNFVDSTPMKDNHRSGGQVIHFNNEFFRRAASQLQELYRENTEMQTTIIADAYKDVEQQERPENQGRGYVRVEYLDSKAETDDGDKKQAADIQLQRIVANVQALRSQGVRAKDISILVRHKRVIPSICAAFAQTMPDVTIVSDEAFRLDSSPAVNFIILALRLVANPHDRYLLSTLAWQYRTAVLHDSACCDINSIFLLSDDELYSLLPSDFRHQEETLAMEPLYELAEHIYDLFSLQALAGQDAYLFSFFDQLMAYLSERPSDLDHFLEYWDQTLCQTTIPVGETDGIRILTIHKSKGLEFNSVIVPYCDWRFVNPSHKPLMWCQPTEAPFSDIDLLPVDADDTSRDSLFAADYADEKLKNYVDNLNLLYVAFTRAKDNLIILSDTARIPKNGEGAAYILSNCLPDTMQPEDEKQQTFCTGQIVPSPDDRKPVDTKDEPVNVLTVRPSEQPTQFVTQKVQATFRQSNLATQFVEGLEDTSDGHQRYLNEGVLFHQLLSMLRTPDDLPAAVRRMDFEGYFSNRLYRQEVMQLVEKALSQTEARNWFDPHWQVINECSILYRDDDGIVQQRRPDRVVTDGRQTIVIDYKTGRQDEEHLKQVAFYMQKLTEMNYPNVSGYVWYIRRGDIVPVPHSDI